MSSTFTLSLLCGKKNCFSRLLKLKQMLHSVPLSELNKTNNKISYSFVCIDYPLKLEQIEIFLRYPANIIVSHTSITGIFC